MSDEPLLGLIWSANIMYGTHGGYALAITPNRVVGAPRSAVFHSLVLYLGSETKATDEDRQQANQVFQEMLPEKNLEIPKDSITKILWKKEGFLHTGHFLFKTTLGDFEIKTNTTYQTVSVVHTVNQITASLMDFAADRFYNEKTGGLMLKEATDRWLKAQKKP